MRLLVLLLLSVVAVAQQTQKVDFTKASGNIFINAKEKKVFGTVKYIFSVKEMTDTIRIDAQKMSFSSVKINNKTVKFNFSSKTLNLFEGFKKGKNTLVFSYEAYPKQTMYFTGVEDNLQIWTQGQGKYTSHWFPSFDDVNEKVIFNLHLTFDKKYNVIANGFLKSAHTDKNVKKWYYEMKKPMSSYLLMIVIGDFNNKVITSKSGIPLQFFIQPKDTNKFESTYRYSKQIFDFLEKEIGVKYPWKLYKQIPVEDFLYAGMENTSATIFAQDYVVDSIGFNDRNYVNVNAHELAHQWFGDLVTAKSGKHHWLQEGFATYYALLAEREVFGDDYFYHQLYRTSIQLRNAAKNDTIPVMHEKASTLSFYQKGAWALHFMRETIGAKAFQKAVKCYLKKYKYKNVETDDFLAFVHKVDPTFDIENFKKMWLEDYRFHQEIANSLLKKNKFINTLFEVQQLRKKSLNENRVRFVELLKSDVYYPVKTEIIYQLREKSFDEKAALLKIALQTNDIKVRQAVAEFSKEIPLDFKADYETLLDDASYDTKEIAFMNLWKNFPDDRTTYLDKAKNWIGGNDKSLRILFLTFALNNEQIDKEEKANYYQELINYTSENYESSVRQNAFINLFSINDTNEVLLKNLVNATTHHKWQFTKYARDKIRNLLKNETIRMQFELLLPAVNDAEKNNLQKLLNEKP
jgi:aminopeptidase N